MYTPIVNNNNNWLGIDEVDGECCVTPTLSAYEEGKYGTAPEYLCLIDGTCDLTAVAENGRC